MRVDSATKQIATKRPTRTPPLAESRLWLWYRGAMNASHASPDFGRALRRRGALIIALFALVWAAAGSSGIANSAAAMLVLVVALVVTVVAVLLALPTSTARAGDRPRQLPANWNRRVGLVNIFQAVAIGLVLAVLNTVDKPAFIPAAVCLIVGVHFFPLAPAFDQPQYQWTAAAMCAVATAGFVAVVAIDGETSRAVVGMGAAITLWGTSLHITNRG